MKELPNKPSELLTLALDDLEIVEKETDKYVVSMDYWHHPAYTSKNELRCHVCLAGAVLAKEVGFSPNSALIIRHSSWKLSPLQTKLVAINALRQGFLESAFSYLEIKKPSWMKPAVKTPDYKDDPTFFKLEMRDLARQLKERGY